jgi:hypothetical protein
LDNQFVYFLEQHHCFFLIIDLIFFEVLFLPVVFITYHKRFVMVERVDIFKALSLLEGLPYCWRCFLLRALDITFILLNSLIKFLELILWNLTHKNISIKLICNLDIILLIDWSKNRYKRLKDFQWVNIWNFNPWLHGGGFCGDNIHPFGPQK